jgi:hypothetical protein
MRAAITALMLALVAHAGAVELTLGGADAPLANHAPEHRDELADAAVSNDPSSLAPKCQFYVKAFRCGCKERSEGKCCLGGWSQRPRGHHRRERAFRFCSRGYEFRYDVDETRGGLHGPVVLTMAVDEASQEMVGEHRAGRRLCRVNVVSPARDGAPAKRHTLRDCAIAHWQRQFTGVGCKRACDCEVDRFVLHCERVTSSLFGGTASCEGAECDALAATGESAVSLDELVDGEDEELEDADAESEGPRKLEGEEREGRKRGRRHRPGVVHLRHSRDDAFFRSLGPRGVPERWAALEAWTMSFWTLFAVAIVGIVTIVLGAVACNRATRAFGMAYTTYMETRQAHSS